MTLALVAATMPLAAQERVPIPLDDDNLSEPRVPPQRIDLAPQPAAAPAPSQADIRECEEEVDASEISGEIIVCRQRGDDPENWFSGSAQAWADRYARESAYINDPQAPDVDNTHHPFVGSGLTILLTGCFIPPCPGPHPLMIDVEALPPPPEGSDADRIARGLDPIGEDGEPSQEARELLERELGLPPSRYDQEPEEAPASRE
ncbi:hypothetical protein CD351_01390 [Erythrobacter sp. KY5]|uniref:hypothetical protein n=1 Tax=Erythrobacter sp. KY5 TaxID=2011159 RepID=UPI000DBF34B2|nr:hypothetical protein [Erythrobacter sp. KY5]AWW73074.1 hypothetical protein CD351_01390 [Erythrobacter sp. KY5]